MSGRTDTRRLFEIVIVGIVLYVVLDAISQLLPPHYSLIRDAESDLAVGPYGYIMTINFLNRGILSLVFIYALAKTVRSTALPGETWGANTRRGRCSSGSGEPEQSCWLYSPRMYRATPISWHGAIHLIVAILAFLGGAFGELRLSLYFGENPALRGIRRAALAISILAVISVVVDLGLPFLIPHLASRVGGLTERVFLGLVLLWMAVVSAHLLRQRHEDPEQVRGPAR